MHKQRIWNPVMICSLLLYFKKTRKAGFDLLQRIDLDMKNTQQFISIRGARQHNLKSIDIDIPKNSFVVITGPSGSGKSSLAFDTLYAEGQRRYVESLSSYARQFISQHGKPDVDSIVGLSPAISIDQRTTSKNPRSTVATITEIYDYIRLLFARIGGVYSPVTGLRIKRMSITEMMDIVSSLPIGTKFRICAPIILGHKGEHVKELDLIREQGYERIKVDGKIADIHEVLKLERNKYHTVEVIVDRVIMSASLGNRVMDSFQTAINLSHGVVKIDVVELPSNIEESVLSNGTTVKVGDVVTMSQNFSCPLSNFSIDEMEPRMFSFNSQFGACTNCNGSGTEMSCNIDLIVPDESISLFKGAIKPWYVKNHKYYLQILDSLARHYKFKMDIPFRELGQDIKDILFYGSKGEEIEFVFDNDLRNSKIKKQFAGIVEDLNRQIDPKDIEESEDEYDSDEWKILTKCHVCNGYRLKKESLCVKINDTHVGQVCEMPIDRSALWFLDLPNHLTNSENEIANLVVKEINDRLQFLQNVGLGYLSLGRSANTLSGGESQRIRLASQIGSGLCGVIYVLDEPSIGLHQSDNEKLIGTIKRLRDLGNSVIVVEHDEDTMFAADHLIDIGPGAGENGGYVIAQGTVEEVMDNDKSVTGGFLSGKEKIEVPVARRRYGKNQWIEIKNARANNLKNINVRIPLGMFVVVTGVSGGGKSSLVMDTVYSKVSNEVNNTSFKPGAHDEILNIENIDKVVKIDQSPIGRTPRSNPATYTAMFSQIRDWFAALPESKTRGYKLSRFSFNVKGGRCETCQGGGMLKIEMHFLPDVYIDCHSCHGARYNKETLEVKFRGKSIADVLNMTSAEAFLFFHSMPSIRDKAKALCDVGLDYMKIGQPATTLSGGEAQRIKLARELSKKSTGNTLYVLDEPTTGLHSIDIRKLLNVLHTLVDYGNSMLIIEHNIDVIKTADYVIDIGPKGGEDGGYVLASGTPEEIATNEKSVTGPYIRKALDAAKRE